MSRSALYLVIWALAVIVVVFGIYLVYQETHKSKLEIRVDGHGISIDGQG
ncbi:MAG: hypothetical protein Q8L54_09430 [Devosia sp.]|nr:hypothetical protein [Devosia sp.]